MPCALRSSSPSDRAAVSRPLKIALKDHLGKSHRLSQALARAGHQFVTEGRADLLLVDFDPPVFGYRELIDHYKSMGAKVLLYPHGAGPLISYDNQFEPYAQVDGTLNIGPGYAEVARRIGDPRPSHVIGWSLCDQKPFRAAADVRKVVFAPLHPSGWGTLAEHNRAYNAATYAELLKGPWELTVRHIGTLEQNGLWPADGVKYVVGGYELAFAEMDAADVVVAGEGTYPSLAVARGVPTVVYGQMQPPMYGLPDEEPIPLRSLERYAGYHRFPLDVDDGPLDELLHVAAASEAPIAEWKRRHIGEPLDDAAFCTLVERIVREPAARVELDETRAFTVAGFADELHERPDLLREYADAVGPGDDATLVLWGLGLDASQTLSLVERAVAAAGIADDRLPDVLLLPLPGSAVADRALAERCSAVLSDWPPVGRLGELPRFAGVPQVA